MICCARSDCGGGSVVAKLVTALPWRLVQGGVDLQREHVARPSVLDGFRGIAEAVRWGGEFVEEGAMMEPGNLCSGSLHKCALRPRGGEGPHVFEVARRETAVLRERAAEVGGEPVHDFGTPSLAGLAGENHPPDVPIKQQHFAAGREAGANPRASDAGFDFREKRRVARGNEGGTRRCIFLSSSGSLLAGGWFAFHGVRGTRTSRRLPSLAVRLRRVFSLQHLLHGGAEG